MRKLSNYATTIGAEGDVNYVQYHTTKIVQWTSWHVILNNGGWMTVTTKRKMNQTSEMFGLKFKVFQKKHEWYVKLASGEVVDFYNGMMFGNDHHLQVAA